jgi:hypothetical protein
MNPTQKGARRSSASPRGAEDGRRARLHTSASNLVEENQRIMARKVNSRRIQTAYFGDKSHFLQISSKKWRFSIMSTLTKGYCKCETFQCLALLLAIRSAMLFRW